MQVLFVNFARRSGSRLPAVRCWGGRTGILFPCIKSVSWGLEMHAAAKEYLVTALLLVTACFRLYNLLGAPSRVHACLCSSKPLSSVY